MKTHELVLIAILMPTLILLNGCGASEEKQIAETKPRAVRTKTIASRDLPIVVNAVGRLGPNREVILSAQVGGILMQYDADVGSKVATGEMLAKLDAADYTLALDEARANLLAVQVRLAAAKSRFERAARLLPAKATTPERYDTSEADYKSAKALAAQLSTMVALAQRRLDKTVITAPFGGYVTQRFVEMGQNVAIGDPVMKVADMDTMRVKIHINEQDYVHLDSDDPVTVSVEVFSGTPLVGRVDKIGIQADARTNTFDIEVLVDNPNFDLKAGLTARVAIQTDIITDVVMIGQDCVIFREKRREVFVVDEDNLATAREVKLGRVDGAEVCILEGLMPGEDLVVAGGQYLNTGDKVVVAP